MDTLNFKLKVKNLDEYQSKVETIKKLIEELNDTPLEIVVEPDEIKDINDSVIEIKNSD